MPKIYLPTLKIRGVGGRLHENERKYNDNISYAMHCRCSTNSWIKVLM